MKKCGLIAFVGFFVTLSAAPAFADIIVIGNPHLSINHLGAGDLRHLYLGQSNRIGEKREKLQPYDQNSDSSAYKDFYRQIANWTPTQVTNYWSFNIFNGQGNPPPKIASNKETIAVIMGTPGAVGYIDERFLSSAQGNVKILWPKNHTKRTTTSAPLKSSTKATGALIAKKPNDALQHSSAHVQPKSAPIVTQVNLFADMAKGFSLQTFANRPLIRKSIENYLAHKSQLEKDLLTSKPYLHNVVASLQQRHLPLELALLPIAEGGYTKQTNLVIANKKTLDELSNLHHSLGDWLLVMSAYEGGLSSVQNALKENQAVDFWNLKLPIAVTTVAAKVVALAQLIKYSRYYEIALPTVESTDNASAVALPTKISQAPSTIRRKKSIKTRPIAAKSLQSIIGEVYQNSAHH